MVAYLSVFLKTLWPLMLLALTTLALVPVGVSADFLATGFFSGCDPKKSPLTNALSCPNGTHRKLTFTVFMSCVAHSYTPASLTVCAFSSTDDAFGGGYQKISDGGCTKSNPYTGSCSCPAGHAVVTVDGPMFRNSPRQYSLISLCFRTGEPRAGGAYYRGGTYVVNNPLTGAESCPAGWQPLQDTITARFPGQLSAQAAYSICGLTATSPKLCPSAWHECGTSTPTPTKAATPSVSFSASAMPTASTSDSPTRSRSTTDSDTMKHSATLSSTMSTSVTLQQTASQSAAWTRTQTLTASTTPTATRPPSVSLSMHESSSFTETPTNLHTATYIGTHTESINVTESAPATKSPTSSWSESNLVTPTDDDVITLTGSQSITFDPSLSLTAPVEVRPKPPALPQYVEASSSVGVASASLSSAASAGAASQIARAQSVIELAQMCGNERNLGSPLPFGVNPTGLSVGSDDVRHHRGAAVGNIILILSSGIAGLVVSLLAGHYIAHKDPLSVVESGGVARQLQVTRRGMARLRYPSVLVFPFLLLQDGMVSGAGTAMVRGNERYRGWDVTCFVSVLLVIIVGFAYTFKVILLRRGLFWKTVTFRRQKQRRSMNAAVGVGSVESSSLDVQQPPSRARRYFNYWFEYRGEWVSVTSGTFNEHSSAPSHLEGGAARQSVFYARYMSSVPYFLVLDGGSSVATSLLRGLTNDRNPRHCRATAWLSLLINLAFLAAAIILRPYTAHAKNAILVSMSLITALGSMLVVVASTRSPWSEDSIRAGETISAVAIYVSLAAVVVYWIQLYMRHKKLSAERRASQKPALGPLNADADELIEPLLQPQLAEDENDVGDELDEGVDDLLFDFPIDEGIGNDEDDGGDGEYDSLPPPPSDSSTLGIPTPMGEVAEEAEELLIEDPTVREADPEAEGELIARRELLNEIEDGLTRNSRGLSVFGTGAQSTEQLVQMNRSSSEPSTGSASNGSFLPMNCVPLSL